MEGSEIFFPVTECPLTALATALVLIRQSANSLEIALDTVPESTIIASTTMSEDSGSSPRCDTSIWLPFFFNSTALMLEEPTSRPTIVFDPIPNMCARLFYCDPAAFVAAFGLCFVPISIWLDFSSIHWSSFDFLKRQRLPSLKAGIFCSPTYLYSVSGLTPRYCEAWRMFMTSRESAIVQSLCTESTPVAAAISGLRGEPARKL